MTNSEYQHQYYLDHRGKKLGAAKRRLIMKHSEILEYQKEWRKNHPKAGTIAKAEWRKNNPDRHSTIAKKQKSKRYRSLGFIPH